jgi:hypothetical protein
MSWNLIQQTQTGRIERNAARCPWMPPLQTYRLVYPLDRHSGDHLRVEIPFTYHNTTGRTVYHPPAGTPLPLESRVSNNFELRVPYSSPLRTSPCAVA